MAGSVRCETYNRMVARVATLEAGLEFAEAVCKALEAARFALLFIDVDSDRPEWKTLMEAHAAYLTAKENDDG